MIYLLKTERGIIMTENFNVANLTKGVPTQFDPNEYLRSMGIPKEIISQGDDAIRKYAEENGIKLVPKGQIPQQPPKGPIPIVSPDNPQPEAPGEIGYSREPNPPQKASRWQMREYYNSRMTEIENDLKEQGLDKKEYKKAMKQARKDVREEINMKFERMTNKDAKAWLEQKKTELKEQNPNMSKKELNKQANLAYQQTFGENPPHGFWHEIASSLILTGIPLAIVDAHKENVAHKNYREAQA